VADQIAFVVLVKNEAIHLERCLASIKDSASEIVVIDSGSTDGSREIAKRLGARVFERPFKNYADQFQWAIENAELTADWIFRLDADEYLEDDLKHELRMKLGNLPSNVTGIRIRLKRLFFGKWVRHGGCTMRLLRLWRRGVGRIEQRWMDEHIVLDRGKVIDFNGRFVDHNLGNLDYFTEKHIAYATREAMDFVIKSKSLFDDFDTLAKSGTRDGNWLKKYIKEEVYYRLPPLLAATMYFLYRYFIRWGFLDGYRGAYYHFLQGFWYRTLVAGKIEEIRLMIGNSDDRDQIVRILELYSGRTLAR